MPMQSTLHRDTNPIPPWGLDKDEMTCGNCKYWDTATTADMGISPLRLFGICGCYAIEPDAGPGARVLLGPRSHCQQHAADFEPSEDFLANLREAEESRDVAYEISPRRNWRYYLWAVLIVMVWAALNALEGAICAR